MDSISGIARKEKSSEFSLLSGLFFRLLPYQVLLLIITSINGIVDSLYASNLIGQSAMSAIGLFGPLNHFLYALSIMFVSGTQILYGRYLARDRQKINGLFSVMLAVSGGIALVTSLLLVTAVYTGLTGVLVSSQPELQMLNEYILGQAVGIPALVLGQQLFSFMSLENRRKWTMAASLICLLSNIIGDHLFIVVFSWQTFGLGLSTSLSELIFLIVLAAYYFMGKSEWKFSLKGCDWRIGPQIMKHGYSGALSRFVEMFRCLIVNFLIMQYVGTAGLSSFAASNSVLALFWPVPFGIMAVARMLFSISLGEEDRRSLVDVMKIVLTRGMLVVCVMAAALILLAEPLTRMFYRDPSDPVYYYTVMGFRLLPLCMPWSLLSLCYVPYAQGAEKKVISVVLPIVDGAVGVVACSLFLIPAMKMNGLYISNILNGIICALVIFFAAWLTIRRFPRSMEDMMAIPDRVGVGPEDRIDISVTTMEEVVEVSRSVDEFCRRQGLDARKSFFAALCMEEMAGNVVTHGFAKDRKKHSVDIRVVRKGEKLILRIRDNCTAFDPGEYHRAMRPGEIGKNIGIQLVYSMATEVSYQNLLGMNVMTIVL